MTDRGGRRRRAGLLIPLFSCTSTSSWGIGDIGDIAPTTAWLAAAGQRVLQILPINEMATGQQSPYSAMSAMAIDPIFIALPDVPEFQAIGGERALSGDERTRLGEVRRSSSVQYASVRRLKRAALDACFAEFLDREWCRDTPRAAGLKAFVSEQAWWIEDYAAFRAIHAREEERPWTDWPGALQRREPAAVAAIRRELAKDVLFYQYLQWLAHEQWRRVRQSTRGVALFGDLPFMVDVDSADVWSRQEQFDLGSSLGAPPDAFSATGQDWGMPVYRWDAIAANDFRWLRERARRNRDLYDGYRVDHLVGFYRTYGRPRDGSPAFFTPATEPEQTRLGERVLSILRESGADIIAEDLGTVPDFVRASLVRIGVPGFRVLRWERRWHEEGQPFRDPSEYPGTSVATSGTHDTEPLAVWWETASPEERRLVSALPTVQRLSAAQGGTLEQLPFEPAVRDVLLESLFASGSDLVLLPFQDVFGWRDRINEPATVGVRNWTLRLPWPVDHLDDVEEARERQAALRTWAERYGRS